MSRRQIIAALSLAGLVLANLAFDVGLLWYDATYQNTNNLLNLVVMGVLIGQLVLVGTWLGLGDGRWHVRLVVAIALALCEAKAIGVVIGVLNRPEPGGDPWGMIAFLFLSMMLFTSLPASLLRRLRGWRLTWEQITAAPAAVQFQISDALLWMMPICGTLAAIRFLTEIDSDFPTQIWEFALLAVSTFAIVVGAMIVAFGARRHFRAVILLAVAVLCIGAVFAMPKMYQNFQGLSANPQIRMSLMRYVVSAYEEAMKHETAAFAAMFTGLANCLALRVLGCKLVRPGLPIASARTEAEIE